MRRFFVYIILLVSLAGCIKNDIPLPVIVPRVTAFEVDGASKVEINSEQQTIYVTLAEATDIKNVKVKNISFEDARTTTSFDTSAVYDLSKDVTFVVSIYQDYGWRIVTEQPIERYFTVEGQVGSTEIDAIHRRVVAYVGSKVDIRNITVSSLKLGPSDITTYSPDITKLKNFVNGLDLDVTYHGRTEQWRMFVETTTTVVEFKSVNAWTGVAWVSAEGVAGEKRGFKYRKKGSGEWLDVAEGAVETNGGAFSACIEGLSPLTEYECYAYSGENNTEVRAFTTEEARQMPNSGFETFSNAESDKYYSFYDPSSPVAENQTKWWCSGNRGSTTVGASYSITNPDANDKKEGDYSVRMESQYVIVKFAAGNIFVGEFDSLVGTSGGKVNFGRPFTLRPRKLSLWLKYETGPIDRFNGAPDNDPVKKGDMDRCQVFVALGDWDYRDYGGTPSSPVQVNTTDKKTFFNPNSENIIGYGSYVSDKSTDGWIKVEIPIQYNSVSKKPTHIIVSCASSMLGDYFTGSTSSKLWVDDVKLEY